VIDDVLEYLPLNVTWVYDPFFLKVDYAKGDEWAHIMDYLHMSDLNKTVLRIMQGSLKGITDSLRPWSRMTQIDEIRSYFVCFDCNEYLSKITDVIELPKKPNQFNKKIPLGRLAGLRVDIPDLALLLDEC